VPLGCNLHFLVITNIDQVFTCHVLYLIYMENALKLYKIIFVLLMSVMSVLAVYSLIEAQWADLFVIMQAMTISAIPYFLEKKWSIHTPYILRTSFILFMFSTLILGEIADLYNTFWWWDIILHTVSSAGITLIGFILMSIIYQDKDLKASPLLTSFLAFSFSMSLAVLWEVYEFFIDVFFETETDMQLGNTDTMTDLIVAIIGALVICFYGYHYVKRQRAKTVIAAAIEEGKVQNL
jgi:hypothetical protein